MQNLECFCSVFECSSVSVCICVSMGTKFRLKYLIRFAFGSRGVFFLRVVRFVVLVFRFFLWFFGFYQGWGKWAWVFSVGAWVGSHTLFDSLKNKQNSIQTAIEFSTNRLRNSILLAFKCSKFGGLIFQVGDFVRSIYSLVTGLVYRNQKAKLKLKTEQRRWILHVIPLWDIGIDKFDLMLTQRGD